MEYIHAATGTVIAIEWILSFNHEQKAINFKDVGIYFSTLLSPFWDIKMNLLIPEITVQDQGFLSRVSTVHLKISIISRMIIVETVMLKGRNIR